MKRERYSWRADASVPRFPDERPLMVFDGDCVLCSTTAQFVVRHDRGGHISLTTAQSPLGSSLYRHLGLPGKTLETVLFINNGFVYSESAAAIALASTLGWPWRAAIVLHVAPAPLRDGIYRWIARNRYRWFGRRDTCWLPTPDIAERIL